MSKSVSEKVVETGETTGSNTDVYVCAKAFEANTSRQMFRGTEHIVVDAKPLCGNHHVTKGIRGGGGEYGMKRDPYPLSHRVCERCAESFISEYGSNDAVYNKVKSFEKGDWVEMQTENGVVSGRVRHDAGALSYPARYVSVVTCSTPKERWVSADVQEVKLRFSEGDNAGIVRDEFEWFVSKYGERVSDVSKITPPENNIDQRTSATTQKLASVIGDVATTVMPIGVDERQFLVNTEYDVSESVIEERIDAVSENGFSIGSVSETDREFNSDGEIAIDDENVSEVKTFWQVTVYADSLVDVGDA